MSDTPRTDSASQLVRATGNGVLVHANFARQLERENDILREMESIYFDMAQNLKRENAKLRAALKPLLRHRPDGDIDWRGNTKAKCGWILVSDILRIEAALESKEAQP